MNFANPLNQADRCPVCNARKPPQYTLCKRCNRKHVKELRRSARLRKQNEAALKKCTRLPRKTLIRSKLVDALLAKYSNEPAPVPKKPKTILHPNLEKKLLLKKLESFD